MASYRNPYNQAIANHQKRLDVANLKNDYAESLRLPLHGGGYSGGGLSGGDFWSDFADGFMSVWNPIIDTAGKVAPFLPLLGLGEEGLGMSGGDMSVNAPYEGYVYGSGMSGGEDWKRIGLNGNEQAERSLVNLPYIGGNIANSGIPPFNEMADAGMSGGRARDRPKVIVKQNDYCCLKNGRQPMPCNGTPLPKSYMNDYQRKGATYRQGKLGNGLSGGDEISDTDHPVILNPELQATAFLGGRKPSSVSKKEKIGMVQQVIADMLKEGRGMSGGDFWSDLGDTFSKVAPFLPLLGLGESGGGYSGGAMTYEQNMNMADAMGDIFSGMGMSGGKKLKKAMLYKQLKNLHGRGLSGGDFDWSSLLSFAPLLLGLGMSGGQMNMSEIDELKPLVLGLGMSGGDFWDDLSKGFSDAWNWVTGTAIPAITPIVDTAGKIADVAGKFQGKKEGKGVSGGRIPAMTTNGDFFSDADLTGMGTSGGSKASDTRMKSGDLQLYKSGNGLSGGMADRKVGGKRGMSKQQRLALKIAHLQGKGIEPTSDIEKADALVGLMARANPAVNKVIGDIQSSSEKDPEPPHAKGLGVSGGKKTSKWITHVKAYAKQHGIKYGEALKRAKATYRG
ncbi:hypothetical protein [Dishui Lake virophage 8]|nr:hypothetical protein [Dishui Lake virophage 5]QIG59426.1 hypothetical protein [Dishui Lake virophage 8]